MHIGFSVIIIVYIAGCCWSRAVIFFLLVLHSDLIMCFLEADWSYR